MQPNTCRNRAAEVRPIIGRDRARGFTLVELLIVMLILVIAAAIATPMLANTHVHRLRGAAEMLAADLAFAQVESITHPDDLRLVIFEPVQNRYRVAATSDPATPVLNSVGRKPLEVTFGQGRAAPFEGVTIHSVNAGGDDRLEFGPYGQLDQATPATIVLACKSSTLTVTIDPVLGEAQIGEIE